MQKSLQKRTSHRCYTLLHYSLLILLYGLAALGIVYFDCSVLARAGISRNETISSCLRRATGLVNRCPDVTEAADAESDVSTTAREILVVIQENTMKGNPARLARLFLPLSTLLFAGSLMAESTDNTKRNKDQTSPTADQQKMNASDREITPKIRKAINEDKSLATYAHNIKIITQDGKVTLRGPVQSEDERDSLQAKAVAGKEDVTNQLEIAPPK